MKKPYKHKRGSRVPSIILELSPSDPLLDITSLNPKFWMRNEETGVTKIAGATLTIVNASSPPRVRFDWGLNDSDTSGVFSVEVSLTHPGGLEERLPGYDGDNPRIIITDQM